MNRLFVFAFMLGMLSCTSSRKAQKPVTEADAAMAIRQVWTSGVDQGISVLARLNGFNTTSYRLGLPADAQAIESALRQIGMGSLVDKAITQINKAAEDAVGAARPVFKEAVLRTPISDPKALISGPADTATRYFRQKNREALMSNYLPVVKSSLEKMQAAKFYNDILNAYNGFPTTKTKLNPDLDTYVTNQIFNALFDQMAKTEADVRSNRAARKTDLEKRVFGEK